MKTLSFKLPNALLAEINSKANEKGITKSDLLREALDAYFRSDQQTRGSCHDLAADVAGCIEGPGDLSFNKKHMEGFGK
jgi:metal-responsive CopG/Arc/MetJ family transcriptional regulator